jgi:hypothetical protein
MHPFPDQDLVLSLCANPGGTCKASDVMMARVRPDGILEILSAAAWARALGYAPDELSGKSLRELTQLESPAESRLVGALLERKDPKPLEVTLYCKGEQRKSFRLYCRFDPYQDTMYFVADELASGRAPREAAEAGARIHA